MERKKWFWPLATVAIFFALGWFVSFTKSDREHKREVLATSEIMLCQYKQVVVSKQVTLALMKDYGNLLDAKYDFGEDTFSMLGGDKKLTDAEKAIFLSKLYTQAQEMIYNGMAQTADPTVFKLGFPKQLGDPNTESGM
ncbi:MAG: hypothetical protein WA087_03050 [Candidatus Saccharimonadales bacterium]